jgi:hypothetical protein
MKHNTHHNKSIAEKHAEELQDYTPRYFAQVPHCIDELTYDYVHPETGKITKKRLSVYAKELYRIIKKITGENGTCWASAEYLAEMCNMSEGRVSKSKWELQQAFHQLDGKPLIAIQKEKKTKFLSDKILNKTERHIIRLYDIWNFNGAHMSLPKEAKKILNYDSEEGGARSPRDRAIEARSPRDRAPQEARSPRDPNNNNIQQEPIVKEQQPVATRNPVVFLNQKEKLFMSSDKKEAYEWMVKNKCEEKIAFVLAQKYSVNEISEASKYLEKKSKSQSFAIKNNKWAYFQNILQKRYWESPPISQGVSYNYSR